MMLLKTMLEGGIMDAVGMVNKYLTTPHLFADRKRNAFYPSEASVISRISGYVLGKCRRAVYYSWKDVPKTNEIDARGMWTMNFGKQIELMYTGYFKELGIWAGNNMKYHDKARNISGETDIFLFDKKKIVGVEIKTAYGYGFQKNVKNFPKPDNLMQVMLYLDYFGTHHDITTFILLYHSRDTMENLQYTITLMKEPIEGTDEVQTFACVNGTPYREFSLEDMYMRYGELGMFLINEELPPKDYTYCYSMEESEDRFNKGVISKTALANAKSGKKTDSDWRCLYCSHLDHCWATKRAEVKAR